MKNKLLLPHRFKLLGLLLLVPSLAIGIAALFFDLELSWLDVDLPKWLPGVGEGFFNPKRNNLTDEVVLSLVLLSMLTMCFSAEKAEDEFIRHTRMESLQWAVLVNYIVLFVSVWIIYNEGFWYVMILSMLTIPVIFLLRFHWILYCNNEKEEGAL